MTVVRDRTSVLACLVPTDDALFFAERLLALLDATQYRATYKLATLLALIDVAAERTGRFDAGVAPGERGWPPGGGALLATDRPLRSGCRR
jgi:hypothetical protein